MSNTSKYDAMLTGGFLGAISLSIVTYWLLKVFDLLDGSEFELMFLIFTVPSGGLLGMAAGVSPWLQKQGRVREAGMSYIQMGLLVALGNAWIIRGWSLDTIEDILSMAILFGLPLVLALRCILYGVRLLHK